MIQLDIRSLSWKKQSNSDSQCCYESDSIQKPPTRYDSGSDSVTLLVNAFDVSVVGGNCPVRYPLVTNLAAVEMKLTEMQDLALKTVASATLQFFLRVCSRVVDIRVSYQCSLLGG